MIKVLFVDDDRVTQKLVKEILSAAGYAVETANDPREGFEKLNNEPFDVVLTDANIPGGFSGFAFVKTLRGNPKYEKLPIAMITGRRDKKDIQLGLECGADDYIIKPIDPLILASKVEGLLKKSDAGISHTNLPEGQVRQRASWTVDLEITHISERGVTFTCPVPPAEDMKIRLSNEFFTAIGIQSPMLRIVKVAKDSGNPKFYDVKTIFIGLTDDELQKIRAWLYLKFPPKKAA